jgi:hypothetical protein
LGKRAKELAPNKKYTLTTYHVGADPVICDDKKVIRNCSFTPEGDRSIHNGENIELLKKSAAEGLFDFYQVMAYDAGRNFKYRVAMRNYAKYVPKEDLILGLSINTQWSPGGSFVEVDDELDERADWARGNGFKGIFTWNLGSNGRLYTVTRIYCY